MSRPIPKAENMEADFFTPEIYRPMPDLRSVSVAPPRASMAKSRKLAANVAISFTVVSAALSGPDRAVAIQASAGAPIVEIVQPASRLTRVTTPRLVDHRATSDSLLRSSAPRVLAFPRTIAVVKEAKVRLYHLDLDGLDN